MSPYYAVVRGRQTGIFESSVDSRRQTDSYPGQLFKKFDSEIEAIDFLIQHQVEYQDTNSTSKSKNDSHVFSYFSVARGRSIGIYDDIKLANKQTHTFKGQVSKGFDDLTEAKDFFRQYNPNEPKDIPIFMSKTLSNKELFKPRSDQFINLSADTLKAKKELTPAIPQTFQDAAVDYKSNKYYTVAVGKRIGIFTDATNARRSADGVSGQKIKGFQTKKEAVNYYQSFHPNKHPKILDIDISDNSESAYFAVIVGREPGIYTSSIECRKQTDNVPGQRSKKFKTLKEAQQFMQQSKVVKITVPSISPFTSTAPRSRLSTHPDNSPKSRQTTLSSVNHQSQGSNIPFALSYASHLIYVRIPNPHLSKSLLSTSTLDQLDFIKHGITSQSLGDRNSRESFKNDGGYFKYTVALNDRGHAERIEEYFNEKFKDFTLQGKTEYFQMALLSKYYEVPPNCESVADAHFHSILQRILTAYPEYVPNISSRIQKFEIRVVDNPGNYFVPTLKVDVVPTSYAINESIASLIAANTIREHSVDLKYAEVRKYIERLPHYNEIKTKNVIEREKFKLDFFTDFVKDKSCDEILKNSMLLSMSKDIWLGKQ
eukprot:NODE_708_length_4951_cov_0.361500.p1 type:complete len:599 gc:universal NODE_708_length_4951_cov_0.361500:3045-4841(+)